MAGKNQVTLTFAGDSSKLEYSFAKVGSSAKSMGDDVGKASRDTADAFDRTGKGLDNTYDKADALESVGRGTADTMSGLGAIMKGDVLQGSTDLAGGVAALADGIGGAMIPALKAGVTAIKSTTVAQKAMNLAMRLNPIGLIITALVLLVGGLILAYKKSETFRNIVNGALGAVRKAFMWLVDGFGRAWQTLSGAWSRFASWIGGWKQAVSSRISSLFQPYVTAFGNAWSAVSGAWGRFTGWVSGWKSSISSRVSSIFSGVVSAFGSAWTAVSGAWSRFWTWVGGWKKAFNFSGMFDGIMGAFKGAINWVIGKWNSLSFSIPAVDTHIPGVGKVGGFSIGTPDIPYFHRGGIMPGSPGTEGLAVLQAGERVQTRGQQQSEADIVIRSGGSRLDDLIVELLRKAIKTRGGNVQTVLGST